MKYSRDSLEKLKEIDPTTVANPVSGEVIRGVFNGLHWTRNSAGVIVYGAPASGSANYIQNQNASAQSANMWISGSGTFGGALDLKAVNSWRIASGNDAGAIPLANTTSLTFRNYDVSLIPALTITATGAATFASSVKVDNGNITIGGGSFQGTINKQAVTGLQIRGIVGTGYDIEITNAAGNTAITVETATANVKLWGTLNVAQAATFASTVTATAFNVGNQSIYEVPANNSIRLSNNLEVLGTLQGYGRITTTERLGSTIATGTAPLSILSTTMSPNLNADLLDGYHASSFQLASTIAGTTNYLSKFTGAGSLGNSLIYDNGTNVGIGTVLPNGALDIFKNITYSTIDTFTQLTVGNIAGATGKRLNIGYDDTANIGFLQSLERGIGVTNLVLQRYGGNVGIGTTTPVSIGTGITSIDIQGTNAGGITFGLSGIKNYIYGASTLYVEANTTLSMSTSGSEKMRITSGGNVGIGYSTGTEITNNKLAVAGNVFASGSITTQSFITPLGGSYTDGYITWGSAQLNRYGSEINFQFTPTANSKVTIGANGSNPIVFDAVAGSGNFGGRVILSGGTNSNRWITLYPQISGESMFHMGVKNGSSWTLAQGGIGFETTLLSIDNAGNTTFTGPVTATGLVVSGTSPNSASIYDNSSNGSVFMKVGSAQFNIWSGTGNTNLNIINSGGGLVNLINSGTITAVSFNGITGLAGNGSATTVSKSDHTHSYLPLTGGTLSGALNGTSAVFSSSVTATDFIGSSDIRLKENILDVSIKRINSNYKTFNFIGNEQVRIGVIAQELEVNHPEFVRTDEEGFKSVSYSDLHSAEIAYLKVKIEKLEELVNKLMK